MMFQGQENETLRRMSAAYLNDNVDEDRQKVIGAGRVVFVRH